MEPNTIVVRQEEAKDFSAVCRLVREAFAAAEHSDGDEQDLVARLRKSSAYIARLSLVAEVEGIIAGHIMFTKLKAGQTTQLCLAPLSVLPRYQRQGIGSMLVRQGHALARKLGYNFVIVLGYPAYYSRFGYVPAGKFGFKAPFAVPEEAFMACNLQNKSFYIPEVVEYPKEFFTK